MAEYILFSLIGLVIVFAVMTMWIFSRYRRCPADRILVVYGKVGNDENGQPVSCKCIHGGAAFIVPVVQSYQYLDLTPIKIDINIVNAISKEENVRINAIMRFTVGISVEQGVMQIAAERLLGLKASEIRDLASNIIFGQLNLVIESKSIDEINSDGLEFMREIMEKIESELKKIGVRLINANIDDIWTPDGREIEEFLFTLLKIENNIETLQDSIVKAKSRMSPQNVERVRKKVDEIKVGLK